MNNRPKHQRDRAHACTDHALETKTRQTHPQENNNTIANSITRNENSSLFALRLVTIALRELKGLPFAVLTRDNAPAFFVVPTQSMKDMELRTVAAGSYKAIRPVDIQIQDLRLQTKALANKIKVETDFPRICATQKHQQVVES